MKKRLNTVLLVDDDEPTNFFHKLVISRSGLCEDLHVCSSALEALNWLKSKQNPKPDLIFLDINMPSMSGWEFLDAYKGSEDILQKDKIKVVMLSTSTDKSDKNLASSYSNVHDFMRKPLSGSKFASVVDSLSKAV